MFYFRMLCLHFAFSVARWRAEETQPGVPCVMSAFESNRSATWGGKQPRRVGVGAFAHPRRAQETGVCVWIGFLLLPAGSFEVFCILHPGCGVSAFSLQPVKPSRAHSSQLLNVLLPHPAAKL